MATVQVQGFQAANKSESSTPIRIPIAVAWTLQVLAAALFLFSGTSKLAGVPTMVQMFGVIGIGQWFRYVTGTIEVVGAVLLLVPWLAPFGALALAVTMVGAILTHLFIIGGSPVPAIALLAVTTTIAWARRSGR
jgi:putative oxidoreductase